MNRLGLAPEIIKHPAIYNKEKSSLAVSESEKASERVGYPSELGAGASDLASIRKNYQHCKTLIDQDLWAMSPLPTIMVDISTHYAEQQNWICALATSCLVAAWCDPYRYPAPFHPVRVRGLLMIAKLLANTAADMASAAAADKPTADPESTGDEIRKALTEIDQISLCELLLLLVLHLSPPGHVDEWEVSSSAQEMLRDIKQLPGREKEHTLIDAWATNPEHQESEAFFDYAVVGPVHTLAELGKAQIASDFGA